MVALGLGLVAEAVGEGADDAGLAGALADAAGLAGSGVVVGDGGGAEEVGDGFDVSHAAIRKLAATAAIDRVTPFTPGETPRVRVCDDQECIDANPTRN